MIETVTVTAFNFRTNMSKLTKKLKLEISDFIVNFFFSYNLMTLEDIK